MRDHEGSYRFVVPAALRCRRGDLDTESSEPGRKPGQRRLGTCIPHPLKSAHAVGLFCEVPRRPKTKQGFRGAMSLVDRCG
jgi:hypothetical protein